MILDNENEILWSPPGIHFTQLSGKYKTITKTLWIKSKPIRKGKQIK